MSPRNLTDSAPPHQEGDLFAFKLVGFTSEHGLRVLLNILALTLKGEISGEFHISVCPVFSYIPQMTDPLIHWASS